jgi:hypothetical protein
MHSRIQNGSDSLAYLRLVIATIVAMYAYYLYIILHAGGLPNATDNTTPTVKNRTVDTGGLEPEGVISGALPLVHLSMGLLSILYFLSSMIAT